MLKNRRFISTLCAIGMCTSLVVGSKSTPFIAEQKTSSVEFKNFRKDTYVKLQELKETRNIKNITEDIVEEVEVAKMIVEEESIENNREYWTFEVSFYCSCELCCGVETGITASGEYAQEGITIATPSDIPFYSKVYIDGLGEYVVHDRGGYIQYTYDDYGNLAMRVDVYLNNHNECYERGRYNAEGYIVRSE